MEFGWINLFGACIVVLMLIPNIVYSIKYKNEKNLCTNRTMNLIEQIGRYACIILMWLPLVVWKFSFSSLFEALIYTAGNAILITAYLIFFARYFKKRSPSLALILAVLPTAIFLLSGITLRHWLLVVFAVLFGVGHIYVTMKNAEAE